MGTYIEDCAITSNTRKYRWHYHWKSQMFALIQCTYKHDTKLKQRMCFTLIVA